VNGKLGFTPTEMGAWMGPNEGIGEEVYGYGTRKRLSFSPEHTVFQAVVYAILHVHSRI
jgi:hypothetical protein